MRAATIDVSQVGRGFRNLVLDSQASFREILWAMAHPGEIRTFGVAVEPPARLSPAAAILLLTLADGDTPVFLDEASREAGDYVRFHCGAPLADRPEAAVFALLTNAPETPSLLAFSPGTDRYPDRSATLLIEASSFEGGPAMSLSGPGIQTTRRVAPDGLPSGFWSAFTENHARFPQGVDVILSCGRDIMGLPRSVHAVPC